MMPIAYELVLIHARNWVSMTLLVLMLVQNMAQCDLEKETAEMMIQCMIREDTVNVDSHIQETDTPQGWQNMPSIRDSWARGICHTDTE